MRWYFRLAALLAIALMSGCAELQPAKKEVEYRQLITVLKPIDGVSVSVTYQGGIYYQVQVRNSLPTTISLSWDDSSYVTTAGQSVRLVRLLDRAKLPANLHAPQADSPIAPGSSLTADFTGESWGGLAKAGRTPRPADMLKKARIFLQFNVKGKLVDWRGEVVFLPIKPS